MFYSQFILAKKGPLGTIWIAAHLERKLRKNQVADTDIGVSVDSILFPEVPIALRLSSHLLLGVVRIYSRKVNYLFHDCSEALLKIKQAFRSTAVDLPPEESTAPYHSITLPETFDLDDFELPDNDLFQGNFVDHHVSTREQITLQDTMDGLVYSTSQFGPDERFGDGDASQIGLELHENLLMNRVSSPMDTSALLAPDNNVDPQTSCHPDRNFADMDIDEPHIAELPATGLHALPVQTPDLNEVFSGEPIECSSVNAEDRGTDYPGTMPLPSDLSELDHAPSTPGLAQEANRPIYQNTGDNSHVESGDPESGRVPMKDSYSGNSNNEVDCPTNCKYPETPISSRMPLSESSPTSVWTDSKPISPELVGTTETLGPADDCLDHGVDEQETLHDATPSIDEQASAGEMYNSNLTVAPKENPPEIVVPQGECILHEDCPPVEAAMQVDTVGALDIVVSTSHIVKECSIEPGQTNSIPSGDDDACGPNPSSGVADFSEKEVHKDGSNGSGDAVDKVSEGQILEKPAVSEIDADLGRSDVSQKEAESENLNLSMSSDIPAPETGVLAPITAAELPIDLVQSSADKDTSMEGNEGINKFDKFSGKKRKLLESTPDLQKNDVDTNSSGNRSKKSAVFVPDDDDVLASILVGRRKTPQLKVKATPIPLEVTSSKRTRMTVRANAPKRKVLVDEAMVMQGDAIRQQLTSTEDIRRVRRKAPCTRPEIWIIERSSLEDEMFTEPLFDGMSAALAALPYQEFDRTEGLKCSGETDSSLEHRLNQMGNHVSTSSHQYNCEAFQNEGTLEFVAEEEGRTQNRKDDQTSDLVRVDLDTEEARVTDNVNPNGTVEQLSEGQSNAQSIENNQSSDLAAVNMDTQKRSVSADVSPLEGRISNGCLDQDSVIQPSDNPGLTNSQTVDASTDVITAAMTNEEGLVNSGDENAPVFKDSLNVESSAENVEGSVSLNVGTLTSAEEHAKKPGESTNEEETVVDMQHDPSSLVEQADSAFHHSTLESFEPSEEALERNALTGISQDVPVTEKAGNEDENLSVEHTSKHTSHMEEEIKNIPLNGGSPGLNEGHPEIAAEGEMWPPTQHANNIRPLEENDTEFLNVDDEEEDGEEDHNELDTEENRYFENSGWSSRTRAVARYLKTLFDNEAGQGRKIVPVDTLLAGKTRKEASRMFFETLVLKTRDYIHVEQENPFANIDIKPGFKLMKSDF